MSYNEADKKVMDSRNLFISVGKVVSAVGLALAGGAVFVALHYIFKVF